MSVNGLKIERVSTNWMQHWLIVARAAHGRLIWLTWQILARGAAAIISTRWIVQLVRHLHRCCHHHHQQHLDDHLTRFGNVACAIISRGWIVQALLGSPRHYRQQSVCKWHTNREFWPKPRPILCSWPGLLYKTGLTKTLSSAECLQITHNFDQDQY